MVIPVFMLWVIKYCFSPISYHYTIAKKKPRYRLIAF